MTICMAAIGADATGKPGSAVVVASDRVVTMANLIEFEHTVPKALRIGGRAIALIAGDSLIGSHLVKEVAAGVATGPITVAQLAQDLSAKYAQTRNNHAEADILAPRGLSWAAFYGQHQNLVAQLTMMLDSQLNNYNLGVELLIAGVDDGGGHIFAVTNPGTRPQDHDVIGYAAVGTGALHALQSMIGFRHAVSASLQETIFRCTHPSGGLRSRRASATRPTCSWFSPPGPRRSRRQRWTSSAPSSTSSPQVRNRT